MKRLKSIIWLASFWELTHFLEESQYCVWLLTPYFWKIALIAENKRVCVPKYNINTVIFFFFKKNIFIVKEWVTNEISSTRHRRALRRGETVKYLLQDSVIDYIYKHSLFQTHNKWVLCFLLWPFSTMLLFNNSFYYYIIIL